MKKLRTFAVSMIIAAIGLLIYCASFYIKSYEQNLAARQEYAELSQMAGVKNREGAGLLADGKKTDEDSSTKNSEMPLHIRPAPGFPVLYELYVYSGNISVKARFLKEASLPVG